MKVALTGWWREYHAKKSASQAANAGAWLGGTGGARPPVGSALQRQVDPAALVEGPLDGVDHFLDPGALLEAALVARTAGRDLVDEVLDEVGVEERPPGL